MTDYGPSLKAARLYERTSPKGNSYLAGRWGALKVAVVKTRDVSETGEPIWQLLLSEAPRPARILPADEPENGKTDWQGPAAGAAAGRLPSLDDAIPF